METCFAKKLGQCGTLETGCPGYENCPFYRTRAEVDDSRRRAYARISGLPLPQQVYIAATYYGGKMPWLGEAATDDV